MGRQFECRLRVRSYEVDSFGRVNNAVFLNYLEAARGDYLIQAGLSFDQFESWQAYPVVRHARLSFRAPLRAEDEIRILGEMLPLRRTGVRTIQQIRRVPNDEIVLEAEIELVFLDRAGKPIAVPEEFRRRLVEGGG